MILLHGLNVCDNHQVPKNEHPVILIVDDNTDLRTMLTMWLQQEGYRLIEARNGQEAIAMTEQELPDLIMMDLQMPILGGLNAAQEIRQRVQSHDIPIIFFSAYGSIGMELFMQIDSLESAPIEYLTKPLDLQQVTTMVASLLNRD